MLRRGHVMARDFGEARKQRVLAEYVLVFADSELLRSRWAPLVSPPALDPYRYCGGVVEWCRGLRLPGAPYLPSVWP